MNDYIQEFKTQIYQIFLQHFPEAATTTENDSFVIEPCKQANHGDVSVNLAMVFAKTIAQSPRDLAHALLPDLAKLNFVKHVEIAGPGFINFFLEPGFFTKGLKTVLLQDRHFGKDILKQAAHHKVNIEYVSANPTGPLHIAHARGAVVGDAIANLLEFAGYHVLREYYINDAGKQVEILARSTYLRYQEVWGKDIGTIPEGYYPGEYLIDVAHALKDQHQDSLLKADEATWLPLVKRFAIDMIMQEIKADLTRLGVHHDVFTSEQKLIDAHYVEKVIDQLTKDGLVYEGVLTPPKGKTVEDWEPTPQCLFKSTLFGDDIDRTLKKSDGSWTYFASDIANHFYKYERGYQHLMNIWGADHGGYVSRLAAAVKAITKNNAFLDVKLCQMVKLMKGGQPLRMSKRMGQFITLRDLMDEVGPDVVRFSLLMRRSDQHLEFDLDQALSQSKENPVFYVQYASARCHSVFRHAETLFPNISLEAPSLAESQLDLLDDPLEQLLIQHILLWPLTLSQSAKSGEPHRIAFYLHELASRFHSLWNKGKEATHLRFIHEDKANLTQARLALLKAVTSVLHLGLMILGIEAKTSLYQIDNEEKKAC